MSNPFADISSLGAIAEEPSSYWDQYDVPSEGGGAILPAGTYTFRVPEPGDNFKPGKTKNEGVFAYEYVPVVVGGPLEGKRVGNTKAPVRASVKKYSNRNGSQAGDLLISAKVDIKPRSTQEWVNAALALTGRTFRAQVDNQVYDSVTKTPLFKNEAEIRARGLVKQDGTIRSVFVLTADGTLVTNTDDEKVVMENGGRKVYANTQIVKYLPPEAK